MEEALNSGHRPDDPDTEWGNRCALHLASAGGYRACVVLLLDRGANVMCKMYDDSTPLHHASESGKLSVVQILMSHGADPHAKDK